MTLSFWFLRISAIVLLLHILHERHGCAADTRIELVDRSAQRTNLLGALVACACEQPANASPAARFRRSRETDSPPFVAIARSVAVALSEGALTLGSSNRLVGRHLPVRGSDQSVKRDRGGVPLGQKAAALYALRTVLHWLRELGSCDLVQSTAFGAGESLTRLGHGREESATRALSISLSHYRRNNPPNHAHTRLPSA